MADVIKKATNKFTKGLVMDFSPENTQNEVLTHALNATLLTFNGNELSLQNDMGNARVETAFLPEGYMPVGTCEYGGIIYIVSYNPLEDKSQIGCFPSPERNVSSDELGIPDKLISRESFQNFVNGKPDGTINNTSTYVLLKNDNLNPGDKFLVCADKAILNERLADLLVKTDSDSDFRPISNPMIALNVVSIEESGKIVYLNSDLRTYDVQNSSTTYRYHILGDPGQTDGAFNQASVDIDNYRNVLSSGYSVFKSKTSGKLAILAELLTIDSYSVTHSVVPKKDTNDVVIENNFDVIIHTEVTPEITSYNIDTVPKLQYYYLKNSQGYLQTADDEETIVKTLYKIDDYNQTSYVNQDFLNTKLSDIYTPTIDSDLNLNGTLNTTGKFDFPEPYTYHINMQSETSEDSSDSTMYIKFSGNKYHRLSSNQVKNNLDTLYQYGSKFYYYDENSKTYIKLESNQVPNDLTTYYIKISKLDYFDAERNTSYQNKTLYKAQTTPVIADSDIINDPSILKYLGKTVYTYIEVSEEDAKQLIPTKTIYIKSNDNEYILVDTFVAGIEYYQQKSYPIYQPLGYDNLNTDNLINKLYYFKDTNSFVKASAEDLEKYWNFDLYKKENEFPWGCDLVLYYQKEVITYKQATLEELENYNNNTLYYIPNYIYLDRNAVANYSLDYQLFVSFSKDTYISNEIFISNSNENYIEGESQGQLYPNEAPIIKQYMSSYIPSTGSEISYNDVRLASIKIPSTICENGLDLPFKYDYTLVPCMSYGRLDHLAVSNTVDFSKLHAFNQSDFTTWKYHIDDNQIRLTLGAEIFDTYETNKVDGLILEFYDLWGFAGSLDISDKKSYSGIFTKILPLNAIGALSKNRIEGNTYNTTFKRNINIREKSDKSGFTLNGKDVNFTGFTNGWNISEEDNDCGTLYSNIVYGVKAYIRRTTSEGFEFIKKREFFLYTLPIYNDYYYTVNDFSGLTNPQLDFMLTYKVKDSSTRTAFSELGLENGYNALDNENIKKYVSGYYEGTTLDVTKFYKYSGISELYLEIGLKPDYQNLNVSYSPDVNKYFTCDLQLVSDNDENISYTIKHDDTLTTLQALGYDKVAGILDMSVNKLGFGNEFAITEPIESSEFYNSNFINISDRGSSFKSTPIPIKYEFIIGYTANITDIRATEVPATTVCALFHKNSEGEYNYEDFGVYVQEDDNGNHLYLSSNMFFNGGDIDTEIFGLCRLVSIANGTMLDQCQSHNNDVETEATDIKLPRKLNSGDPLENLMPTIGKLTFCQPHAHGMSEVNGVNMYNVGGGVIGLAPHPGNLKFSKKEEVSKGIRPTLDLYNYPKYNLSLNTRNAVDYHSEFISTIDYDTVTGTMTHYVPDLKGSEESPTTTVTMREYTGFTGSEIEIFNRKLLNTMSQVYAYNPDYDSLMVNVGSVSSPDKSIDFASHLVSTNSKLEFVEGTSLNDFIYLGPVKFSDYIKGLKEYSVNYNNETILITVENSSELLPQLQFTPGLDLCGVSNTYNLVTSLTYNTQTPIGFEDELSFKSSDSIIVKDTNGENTFLEGKINKKALYGYYNGKLVQLDVSNYYIESDGSLFINTSTSSGSVDLSVDLTSSNIRQCVEGAIYLDHTFKAEDGNTSDFTASILLRAETGHIITTGGNYSSNGIIVAKNRSYGDVSTGVTLKPSIYINSKTSGYSYSATITAVEYSVEGKLLNPDKVTIGSGYSNIYGLSDANYSALRLLVSDTSAEVQLGNYAPVPNTSLWISPNAAEHSIYTDQSRGSSVTSGTYTGSKPNFYMGLPGSNTALEVYDIHINKIYFTVTRKASIDLLDDSVIKVSRTNDYFDYLDNNGHKYSVKTEYDNSSKSTRIRGTSLTLNDLVYDGTHVDSHRLYVRNNCYKNDNNPRNVIYYRSTDNKSADVKDATLLSWRADSNREHKNHLYLQTGPCFTIDNLY